MGLPTTPRPTEGDLYRLERAVTQQGGGIVEEACRPTELAAVPERGVPEAYTQACGGECQVRLPASEDAGGAIACAVCDYAIGFPRFK